MSPSPLIDEHRHPRSSEQKATSRVLFALDRSEWTRFFPGEAAGLADAGDAYYCDIETLEESGGWRALVLDVCPRVIVSAWRTPVVAHEFTRPGGGSVDYVCHVAGSVRHLVARTQIEAGLLVSNWGALVAPIVAEHALLLVLAGLRNLPSWAEVLGWPDNLRRERLATRCLRGKRVAIYGFGAIACELAGLLRPFDVLIRAYSAGVPGSFMREHGVNPVASLDELCAGADILVICEALTASTQGTLDAQMLSRLSDGAVFVNVGRGRLVDEGALLRLAREKHLRIASDVFVDEPVRPDSSFVGLPETLVSPHIGGPTDDLYPLCGRHAIANVNRYLTGQPIDSIVTLAAYDRST